MENEDEVDKKNTESKNEEDPGTKHMDEQPNETMEPPGTKEQQHIDSQVGHISSGSKRAHELSNFDKEKPRSP